MIVTLDQRDRLTVDGVTIDVIPAWQWLSGSAAYAKGPLTRFQILFRSRCAFLRALSGRLTVR